MSNDNNNNLAETTSLIAIARNLNNADVAYQAALKVATTAFEGYLKANRVSEEADKAIKVAEAAYRVATAAATEARKVYDIAAAAGYYAAKQHKTADKAYEEACGFIGD